MAYHLDPGVQRHPNGLIDYDHYRNAARRLRRKAMTRAVRNGLRRSRRVADKLALAIAVVWGAFAWLWNVAPLGSVDARSRFPDM